MDKSGDFNEGQDPLSLRAKQAGNDLVHALLSRWYWLVLLFALAVGAGFYYLKVTPKTYSATATVQVKASTRGAVGLNEEGLQGGELDLRNLDAINTIVGKFRLPSLYESMLRDDAALLNHPDLLPSQADWTPPWLKSGQEPGKQEEKSAGRGDLTLTASRVAKCFSISNRRGTRLVDIAVNHTDALMAQRLANALVATYEKNYVDQKSDRAGNTLKTLSAETAAAQEQLQTAHNAHAAYLTALTLVTKLQEQEAALSKLLLRYRDRHPDVIQSRQLLRETQEAFMREFTAARSSPADAAHWKVTPVMAASAPLEEAVAEAVRLLQSRSKVLESEIDNRTKIYDTFLTQKKQSDISQENREAEILPLEPAAEGRQVEPNPSRVLAGAGAAGLALGAALALLLAKLDNRVHTVAGLERLTGVPVVASVAALRRGVLQKALAAHVGDVRMEKWAPDVFFRDDGAKSIEAEMIRSLRTSLILLGPSDELKTILFSSALPSEGKSFISANVAASFAMQGARTLIVDLDLRKPRQHSLFGLPRCKGAGVVDALAGQISFAEAVHPTGLANLFLMPAGSVAPNPAELLNVERLRIFLAHLKGSFDRIVLDTAPLLPVSDTRLISQTADTCLLVANAENTPKGAILRALELMGAIGEGGRRISFGGCVLNGVVETRRNLGYNYSYGYYGRYGKYGAYGEVYGSPEDDTEEENLRKPAGNRSGNSPRRPAVSRR